MLPCFRNHSIWAPLQLSQEAGNDEQNFKSLGKIPSLVCFLQARIWHLQVSFHAGYVMVASEKQMLQGCDLVSWKWESCHTQRGSCLWHFPLQGVVIAVP